MHRVAGKIALITGAARGIGAETARLLALEGAQVIITDILEKEGQALKEEIGAQAHFIALDVTREAQWEALKNQIQTQFGRLDILFNNAGVLGFPSRGPQDPEHTSLSCWRDIHAINLDGVFLGCKYGILLMKHQGGSIINMSSRSGVVGVPGACAYASSKAAIRNHSKSVALYCAEQRYRIRSNCLLPAAILTPIWDAVLGESRELREKNIAHMQAEIPLGRMGLPMDVAYAVLYLGSDESSYMTGAEIILDGGILAGSSATPQKKSQ